MHERYESTALYIFLFPGVSGGVRGESEPWPSQVGAVAPAHLSAPRLERRQRRPATRRCHKRLLRVAGEAAREADELRGVSAGVRAASAAPLAALCARVPRALHRQMASGAPARSLCCVAFFALIPLPLSHTPTRSHTDLYITVYKVLVNEAERSGESKLVLVCVLCAARRPFI